MTLGPAFLLLASLSAPAEAGDVLLYYNSTYITSAGVRDLVRAIEGVGGSVDTTTSSSWRTSYSGYKLVILLLPASTFSTTQANALTSMVSGGGRLVVAGDWVSGATGFGVESGYVNTLLSRMGVGARIGTTTVAGSGCTSTSMSIASDQLTDGWSRAYIAASNTVSGGTTLLAHSGSVVLVVDQPSSVRDARTPYDVIVSGDVNLFLNDCAGSTGSTANWAMWENLYLGLCEDSDGDGYTDSGCGGTDCDDADASVYPGASERCNGRDDDCDGSIDESAIDRATWYRDADSDSYGDSSRSTLSCDRPTGYVSNNSDCDDTNASIYPGASERCNGLDDDCDGSIDESAIDRATWYRDADGDSYGDSGRSTLSCDRPAGYVSDDRDCDDGDASVNPGASETPYDGIDQDCSGADLTDVDGDGYACACVTGGTDCNDRDSSTHPGAAESADGRDNDCDGSVDEGTSWYDDDGDGFTEEAGDCDDGEAAASPAGAEVCDGLDNDCDGTVDEGTSCYDDDGDGWSEAAGDCNDADALVHPGRPEVDGNGKDDDCDGTVDSGAEDLDGDGATVEGGDCDDGDARVYPGAAELPDGKDNDCDGRVDEGTVAYDDDGDGWSEAAGDCHDGDPTIHPEAEEVPDDGVDNDCDDEVDEGGLGSDDDGDGFSENGGDCDDAEAGIHPGAEEDPGNGLDDDCDGEIDEDEEGDEDGDGLSAAEGDCDDLDGWVNPGAPEFCDGVDNNCDGLVDEGCEEEDSALDAEPKGGCGCAQAPPSGGLAAVWALLGLSALRRRRRA